MHTSRVRRRMNPSTYGRLALVGALAACGQSNSNATSPADGGGDAPAPDGAVSLVQVPLGAYVGTWLGDTGSQYYTSWSDHWTAFVAAMGGRVPTVVGLPGMPYPATDPDQWPNQSQYNVSNWPSVLPKSTSPLLTIWYVDA